MCSDFLRIIQQPMEKQSVRRRTIEERMQPTLLAARHFSTGYKRQAWISGYLLNAALGVQLLVGAFIVGIAAIVPSSPSPSPSASGGSSSEQDSRRWVIAIIVLGGVSIVLTGVMARLIGNGEPERSWGRVRELEKVRR